MGIYWGYIDGKENGNYYLGFRGYVGVITSYNWIMEKKMVATVVYWGLGFKVWGYIGDLLG